MNGAHSTIEAGISYSENVSKYSEAGWRTPSSISTGNIDGVGTNTAINLTAGETIVLSLELTKGNVKRACNKFTLPARPTQLTSGAVKMCIALHEDKKADRMTWLDQVTFNCQDLRSSKAFQSVIHAKVRFVPSKVNLNNMTANIGTTKMTAQMPKPRGCLKSQNFCFSIPFASLFNINRLIAA